MNEIKYNEIKYKVAYETDERQDTEQPGWIVSEPFTIQSLQPGGDTTQFDFSDGGYLGTNDIDWSKLKWLQLTGLKDKNGVEIYEGDVVKAFSGDQYAEVFWDSIVGGWFITLQTSGGAEPSDTLLSNHLSILEVVGNIYENPELFEDTL